MTSETGEGEETKATHTPARPLVLSDPPRTPTLSRKDFPNSFRILPSSLPYCLSFLVSSKVLFRHLRVLVAMLGTKSQAEEWGSWGSFPRAFGSGPHTHLFLQHQQHCPPHFLLNPSLVPCFSPRGHIVSITGVVGMK